jgi:hypothetical protein
MVESSTLALMPIFGESVGVLVLLYGGGLFFALCAGGALFATRAFHGVRVAPRAALTALLSVGASFPVLFWAGGLLGLPLAIASEGHGHSSPVTIVLPMAPASALGARWVAAVLANLTGRVDRTLRRAMVAWAAAWPLVGVAGQQVVRRALSPGSFAWLLFYDLLSPGMVLAWQLPIGLACGVWFLRAGRALPCQSRCCSR